MSVVTRLPRFVTFGLTVLVPGAAICQTGTIRGSVRLHGAAPGPAVVEYSVDQDYCGESGTEPNVVVQDGAVAFAVVSVEGVEGDVEPQEYDLSNTRCHFDPPVVAATAGSLLRVHNEDPVLHNTHLTMQLGSRGRTVGNWAMPRKMTVRAPRAMRRAGLITAECDVHPWMHSTIWVFDHPYFAVSDRVGHFEIANVPAGTHTVKVWHSMFGEREYEVTVQADAVVSVDMVYQSEDTGGGGS